MKDSFFTHQLLSPVFRGLGVPQLTKEVAQELLVLEDQGHNLHLRVLRWTTMHPRIRYKGNGTLLKKTKLERVESMFSSNTDGVGSTTSCRKIVILRNSK